MLLFSLYKQGTERQNVHPYEPALELELWGFLIPTHRSLTENSESSAMHVDLKRYFALFKDTVLCLQLAFSLDI